MIKILLVSICVSVFFISCSNESNRDYKKWNRAKLNNDKLSYAFYLSGHPEGAYRDSAKIKIRELIKTPPPILQKIIPPIALWGDKTVDSLTLHISISSFNSKRYKQKMEIEYYNTIKRLLNNLRITVLPENSKSTTKLKIKINVKALRANYYQWGSLYTGYKLSGSISLTSEGETPYIVPINKTKSCPERISLGDGEQKAMKKPEYILSNYLNIEKYLFDFFYNVWGPSIYVWIDSNELPIELYTKYRDLRTEIGEDFNLSKVLINNIIRACCHGNRDIRIRAHTFVMSENFKRKIGSNFLKEIDPSTVEAIPILIQYGSTNLLEMITGKSFRKSTSYNSHKIYVSKWRKWWFYNKKKILDD